jgi:hypothetical protein
LQAKMIDSGIPEVYHKMYGFCKSNCLHGRNCAPVYIVSLSLPLVFNEKCGIICCAGG